MILWALSEIQGEIQNTIQNLLAVNTNTSVNKKNMRDANIFNSLEGL